MADHENPPPTPSEDEALLSELQALARRADPPPVHVVGAARAALTWRTVDAELAELAYDSAADTRELAGLRGAGDSRVLTFEGRDLLVEVQVIAAGDSRRLVGQLVPEQAARVDIRHAGGTATVDADPVGRFAAQDLAGGPASLRCHLGAGAAARIVSTDWLTI